MQGIFNTTRKQLLQLLMCRVIWLPFIRFETISLICTVIELRPMQHTQKERMCLNKVCRYSSVYHTDPLLLWLALVIGHMYFKRAVTCRFAFIADSNMLVQT
jgi:hypothetical protein